MIINTTCAHCFKQFELDIEQCKKIIGKKNGLRSYIGFYYVCPNYKWTYPFTLENIKRSEKEEVEI